MMQDPRPQPVRDEEVRTFLLAHPDFLRENIDILEAANKERDLGDGIVDFQSFLVRNLQKNSESLKNKYDVLVDFCRDNMSIQGQVHRAALRLIQARTLEQLLEVITQDLVSLFDVDVVRLAMESEAAEAYETYYSEHNYSGIVFVVPGTVEYAIGKKNINMIADTAKDVPVGFEQIFSDCEALIQSCALLKLELELTQRPVILAFGVRYPDRFHPGQGVELLNFLGQIVATQLDRYLHELEV
ncbi:MAG: DUF484 family protein [Alphaproteobacteria bacterium]|nr:DUF484 family protein [Alphaproteobacteria bacterium]